MPSVMSSPYGAKAYSFAILSLCLKGLAELALNAAKVGYRAKPLGISFTKAILVTLFP